MFSRGWCIGNGFILNDLVRSHIVATRTRRGGGGWLQSWGPRNQWEEETGVSVWPPHRCPGWAWLLASGFLCCCCEKLAFHCVLLNKNLVRVCTLQTLRVPKGPSEMQCWVWVWAETVPFTARRFSAGTATGSDPWGGTRRAWPDAKAKEGENTCGRSYANLPPLAFGSSSDISLYLRFFLMQNI